MQDFFANHPMINMFKKAMENPADLWKHNAELLQSQDFTSANPMAWMMQSMQIPGVTGESFEQNLGPMAWMQSMPWFKQMGNFTNKMDQSGLNDNLKNIGDMIDVHKLSAENSQAVLRRQAEIIQKHAEELQKLMQYAMTSRDPKETMSKQSEYMKSTFNVLVADFKELVEMYSKASMDTFNAASGKLSENLDKVCCDATNSCSTSTKTTAKAETKAHKK